MLYPVVTIIIMETFINKMRRLKGVRKVLLLEEAWKAIAKEGMAGYVKYLFKTVRKYFGEAVVVTQEVDDIISSPVVKESQKLSINLSNDPRRLYKEVWIGLGGVQSAVYATEVSAEEYLCYTTEETEKMQVMARAEQLGGDIEAAIRQLARERETDTERR